MCLHKIRPLKEGNQNEQFHNYQQAKLNKEKTG